MSGIIEDSAQGKIGASNCQPRFSAGPHWHPPTPIAFHCPAGSDTTSTLLSRLVHPYFEAPHDRSADRSPCSKTTVIEYLRRAAVASLSSPLPEGLDEEALKQRVFPPLPTARRQANEHDTRLPIGPSHAPNTASLLANTAPGARDPLVENRPHQGHP